MLVVLSAVIFFTAFFLRSNDTSDAFAWSVPLENVDARALAPETNFLALTNLDVNEVLNRAMDRGHWENAYALAAYDARPSFTTRLGVLFQLAPRYTALKDTRKAILCYQIAAQLATLAPTLADVARLDAYAQAITGLRDLNARDAARWVTDQAYVVAQFSPSLQREVRARRLAQIADAYAALGATTLATQARAKASEVATAPGESAQLTMQTGFDPAGGALPRSPELDRIVQGRLTTAQQLQDDVADAGFKAMSNVPKDWVTSLGDTLNDEDLIRADYYDQQLTLTKDEAVRLALLRDKVAWLALKLRVARGGFGIPLVPAWEKEQKAIVQALSEANADLFQTLEAQAATQKEPAQAIDQVVRRELFAARWGWFTTVPEKDLRASLDDNNQNLSDSVLRLDVVTRTERVLYWLVPVELYKQGERARPK